MASSPIDPAAPPAAVAGQRLVWSVAGLLQGANDALLARFAVCVVEGELSALTRPASGHVYFSLRDAEGAPALLRCAMFRRAAGLVGFPLAEGQRVQARGRLTIYEPRGDLQLVVESLQRAGAGALFEQFLRLKARLEGEGLFAAERKRTIAAYPARVGVVTSLGAAALHDVCTALARRAPHVEVVVYPSLVQGSDAPASLCAALAAAAERREVDTLLLVRGGGSLEDLWAFNDERVVRAIVASPIPVVCGVGHETDVTLADFAADLRAPTPTAAAELSVPPTADLGATLLRWAALARTAAARHLERHAQRLDQAALRLARPSAVLHRHQQGLALLGHRMGGGARLRLRDEHERLARLAERLQRAVDAQRSCRAQRIDLLASRLALLDPRAVLDRGYAWMSDPAGRTVGRVDAVAVGAELTAHLADGELGLRVQNVRPRRRR